jgi:hypothetical protein
MYLSAALSIVIEFNITEMLREAGPQVMDFFVYK